MGTILSADEARRAALRAQGLLGAINRRAGVSGVLRLLGAVQLDTISVLARSQELVPFSRLGPIGREAIHTAFWTHRPGAARTFEYWSHAACVMPVEEWPMMALRRREYRKRGGVWGSTDISEETLRGITARLAAEGPLTTKELGGARKTPGWWDWSDVKLGVEGLLATGEVVCVERRGWRRVYDLPQRAIPEQLLHDDLDDHACSVRMIAQAGHAMGVATRSDLVDYYRLKNAKNFPALAEEAGLVPVEVDGWSQDAWADPAALAALESGAGGRHRTTLLSPFDSLIWHRPRAERLFGFTHRLEAYVPKAKRIHGYYVTPLLHGGQLVGRVDPAREGRTLIGRQVSLATAKAVEPMARALREAAEWVGCDAVRVEAVEPARLAPALHEAVAASG
ncbi:MAG TPA: crosslink repair DNA glycosylase YcaQ family protein [Actinocrinis sp.]|uniref:winged helix-turn-helix domain-containing protein n=1 Tax=Actinocrinis sp. TaxID=1920516 RepID=UPI002DDDB196|nr:crosslink repair DNA glycosylase YcaQ family protein [Actinocrinis sp.]HEV2344858.1 crosslink repair DNA glycosylase YcaQ family protein [Actinocrinis sp.]